MILQDFDIGNLFDEYEKRGLLHRTVSAEKVN